MRGEQDGKKVKINIHRAVVVERSRASFLIDSLGVMLKLEGSNPGFAIYFLNWQSRGQKHELIRDLFLN